jgi:hypothetical protein
MKCLPSSPGLGDGMRPLLVLLSLTIGVVPALAKICDLRCDTASPHAAAPTAEVGGHCAAMADPPKVPAPGDGKQDPCGRDHGTGALIGSSVGRATADAGYGPSLAILPPTAGINRPPSESPDRLRAASPAESPPGPLSSSVLRL